MPPSVKVTTHHHHGRHHLTPQHRSLSQQHAVATMRRRTLSHVPRSYSASAATSANASTPGGCGQTSSGGISKSHIGGGKNDAVGGSAGNASTGSGGGDRSRCRSPMMLCHSHSDGEFPMYKGKFMLLSCNNLRIIHKFLLKFLYLSMNFAVTCRHNYLSVLI